jgi:hypothetical protein
VRPTDGLIIQEEKPNFKICIYRPCLLDMRTAKAAHLSKHSAVNQQEWAEYSRTTFSRKTVSGGGGVMYYTCPSVPIAIKYK